MSFSQMLGDLFSNHSMIYYVALPLTVVLYVAARYLQEKSNLALLNPLLIPMVAIIVLIIMTDSNAEDYQRGASIITWLLDPAIVALAIPLYLKFRMIKAQAQGLAMGAAAHAVGTSAANQEGQTQGAYSSLSLIVCGILTSFLATPLFILFRYLDSLF